MNSNNKKIQFMLVGLKELLGLLLPQPLRPWLCFFDKRMKATLLRFAYHPEATLGKLTIDGEIFYTAERPFRGNKKNVSCIPCNTYTCKKYLSPKFGNTFMISNVPNRTYILFHAGNFPEKDSEGCVLIGEKIMKGRAAVANSKKAMKKFLDILSEEEEFEITIKDKFPFDWT